MRWNHPDQWVASKDLAHEPLVEQAEFDRVQDMLTRQARSGTAPKRGHRSRHPYIFKSLVFCGMDPAVVAGWIAETQAERQRA
jgi:hypothetical protein